jgi:hypothetical protein
MTLSIFIIEQAQIHLLDTVLLFPSPCSCVFATDRIGPFFSLEVNSILDFKRTFNIVQDQIYRVKTFTFRLIGNTPEPEDKGGGSRILEDNLKTY